MPHPTSCCCCMLLAWCAGPTHCNPSATSGAGFQSLTGPTLCSSGSTQRTRCGCRLRHSTQGPLIMVACFPLFKRSIICTFTWSPFTTMAPMPFGFQDPSMVKAPWLLMLETDYVWMKPLLARGSAYDPQVQTAQGARHAAGSGQRRSAGVHYLLAALAMNLRFGVSPCRSLAWLSALTTSPPRTPRWRRSWRKSAPHATPQLFLGEVRVVTDVAVWLQRLRQPQLVL